MARASPHCDPEPAERPPEILLHIPVDVASGAVLLCAKSCAHLAGHLGFFGEVANIVEGKYPISYDLRSRSNMGIFLAGATSVVGIRLLPFMLADGYVIAAMTRTQGKAP
jgi:hypothetical protein